MFNNSNNQKLDIKSDKRIKKQAIRQKENHQRILKEITVSGVRDQLLVTNIIDEFIAVIGSGKEATVLLARDSKSKDLVCVKVFRYFTGTIRKRLQGTRHLLEDDMAAIAAKQEYWNLHKMYNANIPVPKPRKLVQNIVIMDFINNPNDKNKPAPLLSEIDVRMFDDPEEIFHEAIGILAGIFLDAHFAHGDYSDHNLMYTREGLVTMDVVQSVEYNQKTYVDTPIRVRIDKAVEILKLDLINLNKCFEKKYRISIDIGSVFEEILKELPMKLQNFLKKSEKVLSSSRYVPELQWGKEGLRGDSVHNRTNKKYQKKKR